ncbi:MAG: MMPL family transporter [Candidatus Paracaedibacteraceae bacterium]|nr:MMPL family transporter [Candidatus Paracaedibacteraceae bacterium]
MAIFCWYALVIQGQIKVDILDMLPNSHSQSIRDVRRMMDDTKLTQRVVILLGHQDSDKARGALAQLRQENQKAGVPLTEENIQQIADDYKHLFTRLFSYRSYLLTDSDYHALTSENSDQLIKKTMASIMNPFGYVNLAHDPFGFFTRYVQYNSPASPFQMDEHGNLYTQGDGKTWFIYLASLSESAFSMKVQEGIDQHLSPVLSRLTQEFDVAILKTGALFYALAGAQQAQNEISFIGSISMLGILLLMILIFRNLQSLFFALTVIAVSIIAGLAVCLMIFGDVHIISLVIGCSLIGITVDYALHYICASYRNCATPYDTFKKLVPALPLSALTSALGFVLLVGVPFPGIQQIGVLSATGLLAALATVFLWGPYLYSCRSTVPTKMAKQFQSALLILARWGAYSKNRKCVVILALIVGCVGSITLKVDDNLKHFQNLNADLKQQEDRINAMLAFDKATRFLTVRGKTIQDVLHLEELILPQLTELGITTKALATLIPSQKRQQENYQRLQACYQPSSIGALFKQLGQSQSYNVQDFMPDSPLLQFTSQDLPTGLKELIYEIESGMFVGRILLIDVPSESDLNKIIIHLNDNVNYCDPARDYSNLFTLYRQLVLALMLGIFVVLAGVLRYYVGLRGMMQILTPISLAIFLAIGFLGIIVPLNFFHAVGLLLSLSIGIDYALFLYWHNPVDTKDDILLMCNSLSAMTTILSFGLLAFSQTLAVGSFGLSVFIGIVSCFILTTVFLGLGGSHRD